MKAEVIRAFYDIKDPANTVYQEGALFEGAPARIKDLERKGFVKPIPEPEPKKPRTRRTKEN